jgi:hypothetical protein
LLEISRCFVYDRFNKKKGVVLLTFDIKRSGRDVIQQTWVNIQALVHENPFIGHTSSVEGTIYEPVNVQTKYALSGLRDVQHEPSLEGYCGFIPIDDMAKEKLKYAMIIHGADGSAYVRGSMNALLMRSLLLDNSGARCKAGFMLMYDPSVHLSKILHTVPGNGDVIFNELKDIPLSDAKTVNVRAVGTLNGGSGFIIGQPEYLGSLLAVVDRTNFELEPLLSLPTSPIKI